MRATRQTNREATVMGIWDYQGWGGEGFTQAKAK